MNRKRTSQNLNSAQVARILGINKKTLYRMLQDGRIQEPPRDPSNNYRIWGQHDVETIRQELGK